MGRATEASSKAPLYVTRTRAAPRPLRQHVTEMTRSVYTCTRPCARSRNSRTAGTLACGFI